MKPLWGVFKDIFQIHEQSLLYSKGKVNLFFMNVPSDEILYQKRIGKIGNRPVYGIGNIGGLHMVACRDDSGGLTLLGAGTHKGVAKYLAKKFAPEIEFDIIEKSQDDFQLSDFQRFLPFWETLTERYRDGN